MNIVITVIASVLILAETGLALHCYQCNSRDHPDCKEYFDWGHIDNINIKSTECKVDASEFCVKTTGVWGGVVGTTRFCSSRDMGNQCQYIRYPDHDRIYRACIYTCKDRDGCNSAQTAANSSLLLFTSAIVSLCMYYTYYSS